MMLRMTLGLLVAMTAMSDAGALTAAGAQPAKAPVKAAGADTETAAARKLFETNLDAIRHRDMPAYLACYLNSESLARTSPEGFQLGFTEHEALSTATPWPDFFEAQDLRLVRVAQGVVYGTYRYRVKYGDDEHIGISERIFLKTPAGWRIAMTSAFDAPKGIPAPPRALVGATLVDGRGGPPVADAVVLLRAGKIECAGRRKDCPVPEGVGVLDLSGMHILPGLIDTHVHFSQTGWADGRPDSLDVRERYPYEQVQGELRKNPERFFRSYLCSGVTAVFDVGGYAWTWGLREKAENETTAPHVAAAGPLISTLDHWLNLPAERMFIYLKDEAAGREGVRYLAAQQTSAVKIWLIPPQGGKIEDLAPAVMATGDEARKLKVPVIVHATGLDEAKLALKAGATLLVHSVWDKPIDDEFLELAKANHAIYCPTLTVSDGYVRMYASAVSGTPPQVDDPQGCVDAETLAHVAESSKGGPNAGDPNTAAARAARNEQRKEVMAANLKRVHGAGIPVAMGTDAGNPLTLHGPSVYAEMEAMQAAGLSPMDVIVASTRNAALAMGRLEDFGTIEPGKTADLVIVGGDPVASVSALRQVRYVVRAGLVRGIDELKAPRP